MNKKLQKKNTFWALYKKWIIIIFSTIGILGIISICTYTLINYWKEVCEWFDNLDWITIGILTEYISVTIVICLLLFLICRYGKFLIRQQYIPLSEQELKENNINNIEDYSSFLLKYLMGYTPLMQIQKLCFVSAFHYLMTNGQRQAIMNDAYFSKKFPTSLQKNNAIEDILATPVSSNVSDESESILGDFYAYRAKYFVYVCDPEINPLSKITNSSFFGRHKWARLVLPLLLFLCLSIPLKF